MLLHYLQTVSPPVIPVLQQVYYYTVHIFTLSGHKRQYLIKLIFTQLKRSDVPVKEHIIDEWDCYYYEFKSTADLVWMYYCPFTFTLPLTTFSKIDKLKISAQANCA